MHPQKFLKYIKQNFLFVALLLLPAALIAGLIDYRFHNYFWPLWNVLKLSNHFRMFDFLSVFDVFVIALVFVYLWSAIRSRQNLPDRKFKWAYMPIMAYMPIILIGIGVIAARLVFTPVQPQIKSFYWHNLINYINPIIIFFILVFSLKEKLRREWFEKSLLICFAVLGIFSLIDYFTNALPGANKDFLGRLVWPYIDPFFNMKPESANWLAYLFGPMTILSFMKLRYSRIAIVAFAVSLFVLLLTKSYTGIIITMAIISLWIFMNIQRKWKITFLIALAIIGTIGVASQYNTPKFQILLGNYKKENSIERRVQIYKFNAKAFLEKPLTGLGPGNYQSYFRQKMQEYIGVNIPEEEIPPHPHNLITFFWSELGIFGLLAILIIYVKTIANIALGRSKNTGSFILLYFLGHGLIDVPYGLEEISVLFWITVALSTLYESPRKNVNEF